MKSLLLILFLPTQVYASKLFIEPGIFINMMNQASAVYDDGYDTYEGKIRNKDLSYAMKFGMHFGHWEFGLESEIYNYVAHFEDDESGDFSEEVQITYNSLFVGYEFVRHHFFYLAISDTPYMTMGGKSFVEHHKVFSLEYSHHIKEWVSFNVKVETASELEVNGSEDENFVIGNLLLVGFSFPLLQEDNY